MNEFVFLDYTPTPAEKHLGIASIMAYGKIVLRFKLIPNKDGSGFFIGCASYKINDQYEEAFLIDSRHSMSQIESLIRSGIKAPIADSKSVFDTTNQTSNVNVNPPGFDDSTCPF